MILFTFVIPAIKKQHLAIFTRQVLLFPLILSIANYESHDIMKKNAIGVYI